MLNWFVDFSEYIWIFSEFSYDLENIALVRKKFETVRLLLVPSLEKNFECDVESWQKNIQNS